MSTFLGTVSSAIIGIYMAYKGYGVWALVAQQLVSAIISTIMLWITVKWKPILKISFKRLKELFKFGWKMLCSGLLDTIYNQLYGLVIGKIYSPEQLAYYNKGNQFPQLLTENINGSISAVMLPTLSNEQDNKENLKKMMKRAIKISSFVLFPMIFGLAAIAEPLIKVLLTDKWLPAVPIMQLLCFSYLLWPIHTINLQAINAIGRSDIFLKLEIIKKIIGVVALIIGIPFGIKFMVTMKIVTSIIASFVNAYPNKKLLNYSYREQIIDILPSLILSAGMFIITYCILLMKINNIITLMLQILAGCIVYFTIAYIMKAESLIYAVDIIKNMKKKN